MTLRFALMVPCMLMINWDFVYVIARICVDGSMPCSSVARTPKEPVAPYASRRQDAGFCLVACKLAQRSIALSFSPDASNSQLLCALCSLDAFVHSFRGSIEITKRKRNVWAIDVAYRKYSKALSIVVDGSKMKVALALLRDCSTSRFFFLELEQVITSFRNL
jgi:hypothetical protein